MFFLQLNWSNALQHFTAQAPLSYKGIMTFEKGGRGLCRWKARYSYSKVQSPGSFLETFCVCFLSLALGSGCSWRGRDVVLCTDQTPESFGQSRCYKGQTGKNGSGAFLSCSYFLFNCCIYLACWLFSWPMLEPVPLTTELFRVWIYSFLVCWFLVAHLNPLIVLGWLTDTRTENTFSEGKGPLCPSVVWNWCFQMMGTRCLTTADTCERSVLINAGCAEAVGWAKAAVAFARNNFASSFIPARQCCYCLWLCRSSMQVSLSAAFALARCDSALRREAGVFCSVVVAKWVCSGSSKVGTLPVPPISAVLVRDDTSEEEGLKSRVQHIS